MRVLHVASFRGNVGDNANHSGLRHEISKVLPAETRYDELEIRRFYLNYDGNEPLRFDSSFAGLANSYDLVIFGGGNFFETWIEHSTTGCTIDIPGETLGAIDTKLLFFGLGFDTYKGYTRDTLKRFRRFLESILTNNRHLVSVRNDGSIEQLIDCYGTDVANRVIKVPDGAFFLRLGKAADALQLGWSRKIVLSVAQDMLPVRFPRTSVERARRLLVESFSRYMVRMNRAFPETAFLLMPHVYSDLGIMADIMEALPDHIRRNHAAVGPCVSGNGAEQQVFANYRDADIAISMRFHGNVVPLAMNVPSIGVNSYNKIRDLYRELSMDDLLLQPADKSFDDQLLSMTERVLGRRRELEARQRRLNVRLRGEMDRFLSRFKDFLSVSLER